MRKLILFLIFITMVFITGCGFGKSGKDEQTENIEVNQKIVLIYEYVNYAETPACRGFYVNSAGHKIQFDFSEIAKSFWEEKTGSQRFISDDDIYQLLLETEETDSEEFLTSEDVSKCYKLLSKISDDYDIVREYPGMDRGTYSWYGILDDGLNPPKLILLSETGDCEGINTDKNAKQIMKILEKSNGTSNFQSRKQWVFDPCGSLQGQASSTLARCQNE